MRFDNNTLSGWKKKAVSDVSVYFIERGCAGTKLKVDENIHPDMDTQITIDSITFHMRSSDHPILEESHITQVNGKWIIKSRSINTHCGCGSSFSLKSENPLHDKIARMKLAMKQKKEGVHI